MTPERILKILADVTEQPIQRSKDRKKRKLSYSGKKRVNTIKTEIVIKEDGQILSVSKSHRGRIHDFKIRKQEKMLSKENIKYVDSGCQGWQKLQSNVVIPYKRYRKKSLPMIKKSTIESWHHLEWEWSIKFMKLRFLKSCHIPIAIFRRNTTWDLT